MKTVEKTLEIIEFLSWDDEDPNCYEEYCEKCGTSKDWNGENMYCPRCFVPDYSREALKAKGYSDRVIQRIWDALSDYNAQLANLACADFCDD